MNAPIYLTQKIRRETVKRLRRFERKNKLKPSISNTIDHLLDLAEEYLTALEK
jgi:hypothetical protein